MEILEQLGKEKMPSILKDPFNKKCVKRVYVSYSENFNNTWSSRGTVEFKNGNTSGEQIFYGETFDDVVIQIKSFINEFQDVS